MPRSHPLLVQLARVWRQSGRWLPNGWLDALRQLALFAGAYYAVPPGARLRGRRGRHGVRERAQPRRRRARPGSLLRAGPPELGPQRGLDPHGANWMYVNSHFVVTTTFLIWLYLARNSAYYFVRNMFMVAMGLALVGYVAYPTAPPRFMPEWGFTDSVADFVGSTRRRAPPACSTTRSPPCPACTWPSR